jgi:hypothetical protein
VHRVLIALVRERPVEAGGNVVGKAGNAIVSSGISASLAPASGDQRLLNAPDCGSNPSRSSPPAAPCALASATTSVAHCSTLPKLLANASAIGGASVTGEIRMLVFMARPSMSER